MNVYLLGMLSSQLLGLRYVVVNLLIFISTFMHNASTFGAFIKPRCTCAARAYGSCSVCVCVCVCVCACVFVTRISALLLRFG